jgi:hypothetical protein
MIGACVTRALADGPSAERDDRPETRRDEGERDLVGGGGSPHHRHRCTVLLGPRQHDTAVYWGAGSKALHHRTVYDVRGYYTFNYLPFASLFYAFAFAVFPIKPFAWTFYGISVLAWIAIVWSIGQAVARLAFEDGREARQFEKLAPLAFVLFFAVGLRDELKLGQTMIVPLWSATAFILLYDRARTRVPRSFGTDVGLAALLCFAIEIKIYFAVLLALLAFRREWRLIGAVAVWHIVFSVGLLAIYQGPGFAISENLAWGGAVRYASEFHMRSSHNMSVMGLVAKSGAPILIARFVWLLAVGVFLLGLWRIRDENPIRGFAACLAAVVPLNPIAWPYWMLLGFPAMFIIIADLLQRARAGERQLPWLIAPVFVWYAVMSAAQNEGLAKEGGLLLACASLTYLTVVFGDRPVSCRSSDTDGTQRVR